MESPLKGVKIAETKELETLLGKTVKLYNKAIAEVGQGKRLTTAGETQYSKRKNIQYISYSTIGEDNVAFIREQLSELYEATENGVADGIAIEKDNVVYIVDSGKDNAELRFGVRRKITIQNDELRAEYVRRVNNDAVSKGYISDGLSSKVEHGLGGYRDRDLRRELREELSNDTRESQHYERAVSDEGRHSLQLTDKTDSNGRAIAESSDDIRYLRRIDKENGNVKRSDEFRKIQAESLGLSDEDVRLFHGGGRTIDERIRGRFSRVFRRELVSQRSRFGYETALLVNRKNSKRKTAYSQYRTLAMQWVNANSTEIGDQKILFDARRNTFVIIQSTKDDEG